MISSMLLVSLATVIVAASSMNQSNLANTGTSEQVSADVYNAPGSFVDCVSC